MIYVETSQANVCYFVYVYLIQGFSCFVTILLKLFLISSLVRESYIKEIDNYEDY